MKSFLSLIRVSLPGSLARSGAPVLPAPITQLTDDDLDLPEEASTEHRQYVRFNPRESSFEQQLTAPSELTSLMETLEIETRIGADQTPVDSLSYGDILAIVKNELEVVRERYAHRTNVRLVLAPTDEAHLPLAVRGERAVLSACVRSLLEQSVEALGGAPAGVVRVALQTEHNILSLVIEDNGRGLSEDLLTKLIAKHEDQDSDAQDFNGASGSDFTWNLPLNEIRRHVESYGGRFERVSRLGVGSRVHIDLPRVDAFAYLMRAKSPPAFMRELARDSRSVEFRSHAAQERLHQDRVKQDSGSRHA